MFSDPARPDAWNFVNCWPTPDVRSFDGTPSIRSGWAICVPRPCGPTAGNSAGVRFHTVGPN